MNAPQAVSVCLLPGDGIGPEIVAAARQMLSLVAELGGMTLTFKEALIGGAAYAATGSPLPEETLTVARTCQAILLGAVGDPRYDTVDPALRPERGLLAIRKALGLYANVRPVSLYPVTAHLSPLKERHLQGVDFVIIRELTGGLYFGKPQEKTSEEAVDTLRYARPEIERIVRLAFTVAQHRTRKRLTSVDKANVLYSSQLWREVVEALAPEFPDVDVSHLYVDNAAMQLILDPGQFDVLVTENMFGDILSDEAAVLSGSLGMLPSASLSMLPNTPSLFEPVHGSAPPLAGLDIANPIATHLSAAMMLEYSLGRPDLAHFIRQGVGACLNAGYLTKDLCRDDQQPLGTQAWTDHLLTWLRSNAHLLTQAPTPVA